MDKVKIVSFAQKAVLLMSLALLTIFFVLSLFLKNDIGIDESSHLVRQSPWLIFQVLLGLVLFYYLFRLLRPLKLSTLFIIFATIWLICGSYLILHQNGVPRSDAADVLRAARQFNRGDFSALTKFRGYLNVYPHQLGLTTFERIFLGIFGKSAYPLMIANLIFSIMDNYLLVRLMKSFGASRDLQKLGLIATFLFLPQFFNFLFIYGLTFGLFFALLGLLFLKNFLAEKTWWTLALSALCLSLANLVRNNIIILVVAVLITLFLELLRTKKLRAGLAILLIILSVLATNKALTVYYQNQAHVKKIEGAPKIAWLAMGIGSGTRLNLGPGWYDAYNYNTYIDAQGDAKKISQKSQADIKRRSAYLAKHPLEGVVFFSDKVMTTWLDGSFESIWNGPKKGNGQRIKGDLMKSIYHYGKGKDRLVAYMGVALVIIYLSSIVGICELYERKRVPFFLVIFLLYFIGGFIFHFFWETKSQYVYPYIYCLLPVACLGMIKIFNSYEKLLARLKVQVEAYLAQTKN